MDEIKFTELEDWINAAYEYTLPNWEQLSSIPLYMDQVMMFMSEVFDLLENNNKTSILTNSMVNNYVKCGLVEHPIQKKYNREHLAKLVMIGMLKQVLSIQDISILFSENQDSSSLYSEFKEAQDKALHDTLASVDYAEHSSDALRAAALRLAAESNARRMVAERILLGLSTPQPKEHKSKKSQKNK